MSPEHETARGPTRALERRLGDWARARLPGFLVDFSMFVLKQGWACLFGALMLAAILISHAIDDGVRSSPV